MNKQSLPEEIRFPGFQAGITGHKKGAAMGVLHELPPFIKGNRSGHSVSDAEGCWGRQKRGFVRTTVRRLFPRISAGILPAHSAGCSGAAFRRLTLAAAGLSILLCCMVTPCLAQNYLIIKKKDGTTQKVPLNFSPQDIESFDMAPSAPPTTPPGEEPSQPSAEEEEPSAEEPAPPAVREREPEPKPLKITPSVPPSREGRVPAKPRPEAAPPPEEGREVPAKRPTAGPVSAPRVRPITGKFSVNVYKLPGKITELPEYSSFKPEKVISADKIDIQPGSRGQLAGLPETSEGLGLRFMGTFHVNGEGIFRWRINAKDGARMHIDDKTLIEMDGVHPPKSDTGFIHLSEGAHFILVDSFNSSGTPVLQLFVTPPLGSEEVFSISRGLSGWNEPDKPYDVLWGQVYFVPKGKYPKGPDFSELTPVGRLIAPQLAISGGEGFPGLPGRKQMIGIRWEGFFNVSGAGIFAFRLKSKDYAKLLIGNHDIVQVTSGEKKDPQGSIGWAFLQKGSYPVIVDYFHSDGAPDLGLFVTQPEKQEDVFSPANTLQGYQTEGAELNMIPAFVYFLKPNTRTIPNYNKLKPSGMFFTRAIDYPIDRGSTEFPGIPRKTKWLGIRFYVKFAISEQEEGAYNFRVVADDGARLIVGNKLVVNAEGFGTKQEKTGSVALKAGSHEMFLDYFQGTGPNGVQLFITPPGGEEKVFAFQ